MAQILTCKNISKSFGSEALFDEFNLSFEEGCRCGIIGPNGTGKSTLLKIFGDLESIDSGEISRKKSLKVAYVSQIRNFSATDTIYSVLKESALSTGVDELAAETDLAILSSQLGLERSETKALSLSGGWQKRLAIAEQLIKKPDFLLLDEPTNHLDLDGIEWLENILSAPDFSWALISHDRFFLDRLSKEIIEINPCYPEGYLRTSGGYTDHIKHKNDVFFAIESQEQTLSSKVRRETEWLKRGPKARTTKARFRIEQAKQLQSDLTALRKLKQSNKTSIDFSASNRKTKLLLSLDKASIGYSDSLYENISLEITKGQRLGILGPNGSGKSTLIKSLMGQQTLVAGTRKQADDLSIVYFSQARDELDPNLTLKRVMGDGHDQVVFRDKPVHIISWAKRFGFSVEDMSTLVKDLSGGQLARAHISLLMLKNADILFLDEPTNDLDIETIEIVENSLQSFPGAIVVISHDRKFMENVCTTYLGLSKNKETIKIASYQQWEKLKKQASKAENKSKKTANKANIPEKNKSAKKVRLSYNEKYELENIEQKILEAESRLDSASGEVESLSTSPDHEALLKATEKLKAAQSEVDILYQRWDELEKKATSASD